MICFVADKGRHKGRIQQGWKSMTVPTFARVAVWSRAIICHLLHEISWIWIWHQHKCTWNLTRPLPTLSGGSCQSQLLSFDKSRHLKVEENRPSALAYQSNLTLFLIWWEVHRGKPPMINTKERKFKKISNRVHFIYTHGYYSKNDCKNIITDLSAKTLVQRFGKKRRHQSTHVHYQWHYSNSSLVDKWAQMITLFTRSCPHYVGKV